MGSLLAGALNFVAGIGSTSPSSVCLLFVFDEPECPQSLLD